MDNPNFRTITFKSTINTPISLFTRPPKSNEIDVRKKSLTTLSGKIKAKILPTTPPNIAPIVFPIPCPTNSLFGLCFVLVILSATTDVKSESIAPSRARVRAVNTYGIMELRLNSVKIDIFGNVRPLGIGELAL